MADFGLVAVTSSEFPLDCSRLPSGPLWERDGSCWHAVQDCGSQRGYRWVALNAAARSKPNGPKGEMTDFHPAVGFGTLPAIIPPKKRVS